MRHERFELDDQTAELLERVRQQEGLDSLDHAAEILIRRRLRKGTRSITGRGRALYLVGGRDKCPPSA